MTSLWVVDPSVLRSETQGVEEVVGSWRGPWRLFRPALIPGDGPGPETGYPDGGVVLMGSAASVHDPLPWIASLAGWLEPLLSGQRSLPLLGICFGHQLIGHLAGGTVGFARDDGEKIVGVRTSHLDGGSLLPGPSQRRVVVSHRETILRLPPGYRGVARRAGIDCDGMEHAELPIFSFQFHPEAREEFAAHAGIAESEIDERVRRDGRAVLSAFRLRAASEDRAR